MTSSERGDNNIEHIPINSYIVYHWEYDIKVNDNDDIALVKNAHKLFIFPR
jgi:hypothetical protein